MTDETMEQQPVPETSETPAETPSIDDTIRDTYKALHEESAPDDVESPEPKESKRARDEHGRFLPKDGKDMTDVTSDKPDVEAAEPSEEDEPVASPFPEAPKSWKKDAQEAYAALPDNIKAEVHRREDDFHKGIEQYREKAHIGDVLDKEIQPYADMIRQHNRTAPDVVRELLGTQHALTAGTPEQKAQVVAKILRDYQIDVGQVNTLLEQPAPAQPNPEFTQLSERVNSLTEQLSQAQLAPYIEQVNKFAADPKNEFFATVEDDMNALLAQGRASDLQDAYDKCIWAHPETRAKLIARQQEAERRKTAEKAAAAQKAGSTNVQRRGTPPEAPANGTIEDTIRNTYRQLNG